MLGNCVRCKCIHIVYCIAEKRISISPPLLSHRTRKQQRPVGSRDERDAMGGNRIATNHRDTCILPTDHNMRVSLVTRTHISQVDLTSFIFVHLPGSSALRLKGFFFIHFWIITAKCQPDGWNSFK